MGHLAAPSVDGEADHEEDHGKGDQRIAEIDVVDGDAVRIVADPVAVRVTPLIRIVREGVLAVGMAVVVAILWVRVAVVADSVAVGVRPLVRVEGEGVAVVAHTVEIGVVPFVGIARKGVPAEALRVIAMAVAVGVGPLRRVAGEQVQGQAGGGRGPVVALVPLIWVTVAVPVNARRGIVGEGISGVVHPVVIGIVGHRIRVIADPIDVGIAPFGGIVGERIRGRALRVVAISVTI